jgi:putative heme-binding domain-containing protein
MKIMRFVICPLIFAAAVAVAPSPTVTVLAQHETAADLLDGERAYGTTCVNCHGPNGDTVPGINLLTGQFRRQYTDQELANIVRNGIPNTAMPPSTMSAEQASKLVSYLRTSAKNKTTAVVAGDAARGKTVYDSKGGCASCHRIDGVGSRVGPDLSRVGQARRTADLELALVNPAADVQPQNRFYRVVLKDGTTVTGRLLGHDTFNVQMIDMKEQLRSFVKADTREHGFIDTPMPSFRTRLTPQELADLVAYLGTLKSSAPGGFPNTGAPGGRGGRGAAPVK